MGKYTTFADLCPITPTSSHTYSVELAENWIIGTVPNGGYTTSNFLICARTHMQHTHPRLNQPHPINLHLEFLRRTAVGPATFTVRDVKLGSRITNLHLTLYQPHEPSKPIVEGYIMMTNLLSETGLSLPTSYTLHPSPLPASIPLLASPAGEDTYYRRRGPEPFPEFRRAVLNVALYLLKPATRPSHFHKSINDQWIRLAPLQADGKTQSLGTARWTNDALGFLCDMFPQIIEQYINPVAEQAAITASTAEEMREIIKKIQSDEKNSGTDENKSRRFWYPTLTLTMNVKKALPEEGTDWLFVRVQSKRIERGRFDLEVSVWDDVDNGEAGLVATSYHASLVLDSSRNVTRKAPGGKKEGGKL